MMQPVYIATGAALLIVAVLLVVVWMRRRSARRVERLESKAKSRLQSLEREHDKRIDRLEREWEGKLERAPLGLADELLSTYDAVESALQMAHSRDDAEMVEGLEMIRRGFLEAFAAHDIEVIAPEPGTAFEPDIHEAMDVVAPRENAPDGTIAESHRAGFRHPAGLIRPALVSVARDETQ